MLRELHIKNYAIVDEISLPLSEGFNVITGETGAGKSLLVDALSLILGERSSLGGIRQGANEAILEASFDPIPPFLETSDLDLDYLILKRILLKTGRSRAYLDGSMASLASLKTAGQKLLEIHGQQGQQCLSDLNWQLSLLDAFGDLSLECSKCQASYQRWAAQCEEREDLKQQVAESKKELSEKEYQLSEIKAAQLSSGEEERLEKEENSLKNWETIYTTIQGAYSLLSEEGGLLTQLERIGIELHQLHAITEDADSELALWDQSKIQLKELSAILRSRTREEAFDPKRLEAVAERLYLIQGFKRKYQRSLDEIIAYQEQLEKDLSNVSSVALRLHEVEKKCQTLENTVLGIAKSLSEQRAKACIALSKKVKEELNELGMEKTAFTVSHKKTLLTEKGLDQVTFQISLPGEIPQSLARVASGGELSRIMLALKVVLAGIDPVPTLVFDEIDAGIGGGVAERVGKRLLKLSRQHQVFCITHLPQIASLADTHYFVEKKTKGMHVMTSIRELSSTERIDELARMLGGIIITPLTRSHAQEMMSQKHA